MKAPEFIRGDAYTMKKTGIAKMEQKGEWIMTQKEFDKAVKAINNNMNKFASEVETSFGFVSKDSNEFRYFYGGILSNVMKGIALGIAQVCKSSDEGDSLIDEIAEDAKRLLAEYKKEGATNTVQ